MTKEERLASVGLPNTPDGVAKFYKMFPDRDSHDNYMANGGSLSGAPHNGQPTARQFFNYGSHANDAVNVPMSNPFFAANGGTPYYGGPVRPYDMGGNTASPMNYGAFSVPMQYGGDEEQFGGSLSQDNNQQYPMMDSGGMGDFANGGDTSSLVKIIIAAGKARKKALGGDTVTQGGNSDNYAENLRNSFQGVIKNNIERNKIEKSLESLTGMQKAFGGSSNQFNDGGYANNEYTPDKNFNSNVYDPRKLEIAGMYGQNAQNAENDFTNSFNDFSNLMFKENGGLIKADVGFEQWAQRTGKLNPNSPLFKKPVAPFYGQKNYFGNTSSKPYKAPAEESAEALSIRKDREAKDAALLNSTSGNTDTEDTQDFDPKKAKTYRFRVNNAAGENYYKNNPNSYYKVNQRNTKKLNNLPEGYGVTSVQKQYGAGARLASNVVGLFGGKEKGANTLNRFAPKKIKYNFGKVDGSGTTQGDTTKQDATQPGISQQMQKDPKDPGFIQNLITKNKQRKSDKLLNRQNTAAVDAQIQSARQAVQQPVYSNEELADADKWINDQANESAANEAENPNFMSQPSSKIVQDPFNSQSGFAYGGGLRKLRRYAGDVEGNEVDKDNPVGMEDISITAKRKRDTDTSKIGMAAPVAFNMIASAKNKIAAQSAAQNTTNADDVMFANNSGKDLGNFTVNQDSFRPNDNEYGRFFGSAPADYGTPVVRYGGNAYDEGGDKKGMKLSNAEIVSFLRNDMAAGEHRRGIINPTPSIQEMSAKYGNLTESDRDRVMKLMQSQSGQNLYLDDTYMRNHNFHPFNPFNIPANNRQIKEKDRIYQEGGGPEQGQQEQIMQGVASMLQQGAQPEEVAQQLVQMGIPQEQVIQIIKAVMQQLQGGQGQPMQPAMRYGGYAMGGSSDEDDEYYEDDIDEDEIDRLQKLGYTVQRY